jgi:hypothetical protein
VSFHGVFVMDIRVFLLKCLLTDVRRVFAMMIVRGEILLIALANCLHHVYKKTVLKKISIIVFDLYDIKYRGHI